LLGWLSAKAGTLFIDQARRRDTQRINHLVAQSLREGEVFAIFPEGTTTDGSRLLKFHASLLAPAFEVGASVQPVAIRYEREDGSLCTEAAFDGERSLWETVIGITGQRRVHVHVSFLQSLASAGRHRRDLAADALGAIRLRLFPEPSNPSDTDAGRLVSER
jgi:1-acyl-sn-glycerol-3-phosphate acyltransferase